jgi:Xaa-Pro aminopeptidase/Xaa-Pro dipeptidase
MDKISSEASAWKEIDWMKLTKLNIERVRSLMKKEGVDAIFAHHSDNFQYVTGYLNPTHFHSKSSPLRQGSIVLAKENEPVMLAGAADYFDAKNFWWIKDVRSMPARFNLWPKIIKETLKDYGLKQGKIAVDSHSPFTLVDGVREQLGKEFIVISAGSILATARSVKNSEEIKVIRRSAGLATAMVVAARAATKEGVREIDVAIEAERRLMELEPLAHTAFKTVVMSGDRAAYLDRIPSNKIIGRGEIVNIDAGCYYLGYLSEFSRHVMVGKPTGEQKKLYRAGFEAEQQAIKAIKPGVKTSEIDRIAREVIEKAGFKEFQHPHYTGHGHGLSGHDLPIIGDPGQVEEYLFEPGMVVAIEPGIFKPGVGGVREEDVVLVTETGHEILSRVEYEDKLLD